MDVSHLFIWESRVLFLAKGLRAEAHAHYNASLIISADKPFEIRTPERGYGGLECVLISPNVYHELRAEKSSMIVLQIDPLGAEYRALANALGGEGIIQAQRPDGIEKELSILLDPASSRCESAAAFVRMLLMRTIHYEEMPHTVDPRVARLIALLKEHISEDMPETVSVQEAAAHVGLSADRLMHLFKEEMGLPIRRYVLWLKLRRAVMLMRTEGIRMTEASHAAGFADSAHSSRTFKDMFGIPPSFFFANDRFVQVNQCEVW